MVNFSGLLVLPGSYAPYPVVGGPDTHEPKKYVFCTYGQIHYFDMFRLSQRMENISSVHLTVNRQIRQLDTTMPRERTVKIFGLPEANIANNETETDDDLEIKFRNFTRDSLHVDVGMKDLETIHRVGEWAKVVPRSAVAYLANNDIKKKLLHASNLTGLAAAHTDIGKTISKNAQN